MAYLNVNYGNKKTKNLSLSFTESLIKWRKQSLSPFSKPSDPLIIESLLDCSKVVFRAILDCSKVCLHQENQCTCFYSAYYALLTILQQQLIDDKLDFDKLFMNGPSTFLII